MHNSTSLETDNAYTKYNIDNYNPRTSSYKSEFLKGSDLVPLPERSYTWNNVGDLGSMSKSTSTINRRNEYWGRGKGGGTSDVNDSCRSAQGNWCRTSRTSPSRMAGDVSGRCDDDYTCPSRRDQQQYGGRGGGVILDTSQNNPYSARKLGYCSSLAICDPAALQLTAYDRRSNTDRYNTTYYTPPCIRPGCCNTCPTSNDRCGGTIRLAKQCKRQGFRRSQSVNSSERPCPRPSRSQSRCRDKRPKSNLDRAPCDRMPVCPPQKTCRKSKSNKMCCPGKMNFEPKPHPQCISVCVYFKNTVWSEGQIEELKIFLQSANCSEALKLMKMVKEVREQKCGGGCKAVLHPKRTRSCPREPVCCNRACNMSGNNENAYPVAKASPVPQPQYTAATVGKNSSLEQKRMAENKLEREQIMTSCKNQLQSTSGRNKLKSCCTTSPGLGGEFKNSFSKIISDCKQFLSAKRLPSFPGNEGEHNFSNLYGGGGMEHADVADGDALSSIGGLAGHSENYNSKENNSDTIRGLLNTKAGANIAGQQSSGMFGAFSPYQPTTSGDMNTSCSEPISSMTDSPRQLSDTTAVDKREISNFHDYKSDIFRLNEAADARKDDFEVTFTCGYENVCSRPAHRPCGHNTAKDKNTNGDGGNAIDKDISSEEDVISKQISEMENSAPQCLQTEEADDQQDLIQINDCTQQLLEKVSKRVKKVEDCLVFIKRKSEVKSGVCEQSRKTNSNKKTQFSSVNSPVISSNSSKTVHKRRETKAQGRGERKTTVVSDLDSGSSCNKSDILSPRSKPEQDLKLSSEYRQRFDQFEKPAETENETETLYQQNMSSNSDFGHALSEYEGDKNKRVVMTTGDLDSFSSFVDRQDTSDTSSIPISSSLTSLDTTLSRNTNCLCEKFNGQRETMMGREERPTARPDRRSKHKKKQVWYEEIECKSPTLDPSKTNDRFSDQRSRTRGCPIIVKAYNVCSPLPSSTSCISIN